MSGVSEGVVPQIPFLWTRGIAACETLHYLDRNGIDAEPLLRKAQLSRSRLADAITGAPVAISLEPSSPFQAFNGRSPVWRSRSSRNGS